MGTYRGLSEDKTYFIDPQIYAHAGIHMHRINTVGTDALIVTWRTFKSTEVQERAQSGKHANKYTLEVVGNPSGRFFRAQF